MKARDVRRGDEVLIWQTASGSRHRGVVALGEVLSDPQLLELPPEYHRFCIDSALRTPQLRVRIRYIVPTGIPLWLDDDTSGTLSRLSVARGTGGSLVHVDPADWHAVMRLVGGWHPTNNPAAIAGTNQRKNRAYSQGFNVDPKMRLAVERHAVQQAIAHYKANGYEVEERGKPYDLRCTKGIEILHVEVKGTQTEGEEILLTPNEVAFATNHRDSMELFVVSSCAAVSSNGAIDVTGGHIRILRPWRIDPVALMPTGYSYSLLEGVDSESADGSASTVLKPSVTA